MNQPKSCADCKFAVFQDFGYSNYTVEGTDFSCAKRMHPDGTFDRFYGEDARLYYADHCEGFDAGESISLDVEGEAFDSLNDAQKDIVQKHRDAP